jgi:Holliday junction resolvase-like predicted endonuclease
MFLLILESPWKELESLFLMQKKGKRTIQFNAKFPLGRIKIISDFTEINNLMTSTKYFVDVKWTLISDKRTLNFDQDAGHSFLKRKI